MGPAAAQTSSEIALLIRNTREHGRLLAITHARSLIKIYPRQRNICKHLITKTATTTSTETGEKWPLLNDKHHEY